MNPQHNSIAGRRFGFTLVELLVVVSIITILLALLVPSLEKATRAAEAVRCGANLHAVGNAMGLYLGDHRHTYPQVYWFGQLLGEKPLDATGAERPGFQGRSAGRTADDRPLNAYLGYKGPLAQVPVAKCPSDLGDSFVAAADNAFEHYGTSYIEMTWRDHYRIKRVFGMTGDPSATNDYSVRRTSIERTDNKVLVADWPIYGDRMISNPRTQWHGTDRRLFNTLFADSHVTLFDYPVNEIEPPFWATEPPKPAFLWW